MSWRYENCGEADSVTGGVTCDVSDDWAKGPLGVAFYNSDRTRSFNIPKDAKEIWIHCFVYHNNESINRFRIYNDPGHGEQNGFVTGICLQENSTGCMQAFCNGVCLGALSRAFLSSWYRFWLHMKSDANNGCLEFYMDGSHVYTYNGNVNNGAPFSDIYLQSDSTDTLFSNLVISDAPIPTTYDVSPLKMSFYYFRKYISKGYTFLDIDKSIFRYCESVDGAIDKITGFLKEYEERENAVIKNVLELASGVEKNSVISKGLVDETDDIMKMRKNYFTEWMDIDTGKCKTQLLGIKEEVSNMKSRIQTINQEGNIIAKLAQLEAEPRASFEVLLENMGHIVWDVCYKINFFATHQAFVTNIINLWISWSEEYIVFKRKMNDGFMDMCRNEGIDEEIIQIWCDEWQKKRMMIERLFLPIIEFALRKNYAPDDGLPALVEQPLAILQTYKGEVDNFYLNERKNIYQKYAFQAGGDLQEKFETESEIYKLTEKMQSLLQEVIFARESPEERVFLLRWAEQLLNVPIDEITNFVEQRELVAISAEVLAQFAELKRQNFAAYLIDSQAYSEALQKREKEYNALIFRMRKDLMKQ